MKEKIKIIFKIFLGILIIIFLLLLIVKEIIYINAYLECRAYNSSTICISVLHGGSFPEIKIAPPSKW